MDQIITRTTGCTDAAWWRQGLRRRRPPLQTSRQAARGQNVPDSTAHKPGRRSEVAAAALSLSSSARGRGGGGDGGRKGGDKAQMERWARSPTKTGRRYEASASVLTGIRRFEALEFSPAAPTQYQPNN